MFYKLTRRICAACVVTLLGSPAVAQTPLQQIENTSGPRQLVGDPEVFRVEDAAPVAPVGAENFCFMLDEILFEDGNRFRNDELATIYADLVGTSVSIAKLYEIADRTRDYYRDSGYVLTQVFVPPQSIDGSECGQVAEPSQSIASVPVRLQVLEAVIDQVSIRAGDGVSSSVVDLATQIAKQLENRPPLHIDEIERVLFLINDVDGVTRATAIPGLGSAEAAEATGAAVSLTVALEHDPFEGRFYADNRQSPVVGIGLMGLTATANSFTPGGDTTTIGYFGSWGIDSGADDFRDRMTAYLEHSRWFTPSGLTGRVEVLYSRTKPSDTLSLADIDGDQFSVTVETEYPLIRTTGFSLWTGGGFEWIDQTTDVAGGAVRIADDRLRVAKLWTRAESHDGYGDSFSSLEMRFGLGVFDASDARDNNLSRFDGSGRFVSLKLDLERIQRLEWVHRNVSLSVKASAQVSDRPLLGSEEFAAGGDQFGRGFDPSEISGDAGFGISGELRFSKSFTLAGEQIAYQFYGFLDHARVFNRGNVNENLRLLSTGAGVRLELPYDFAAGLEVAAPIDPVLLRTADKDPRILFSVQKKF